MARTDAAASNHWETEPGLFRILHAEFAFTVDGAAHQGNALLPRWWGPDGERADTLDRKQPWAPDRPYINPPYNREQGRWVREAAWRAREEGAFSALLVPSYTDTDWWHEAALLATEIRELRGRLGFFLNGQPYTSARFANAVLIFGDVSARRLAEPPAGGDDNGDRVGAPDAVSAGVHRPAVVGRTEASAQSTSLIGAGPIRRPWDWQLAYYQRFQEWPRKKAPRRWRHVADEALRNTHVA